MVSLWYQETSKQLMVKVIKAKNLLKTELVGKADICKEVQPTRRTWSTERPLYVTRLGLRSWRGVLLRRLLLRALRAGGRGGRHTRLRKLKRRCLPADRPVGRRRRFRHAP